MSHYVDSISDAVQRLCERDTILKLINLFNNRYTDADLNEMVDCLLAHPDIVTHVYLGSNQLTDETGVKLARYVAASSTIQTLSLSNNQIGSATYLAMAAALRVNSSLKYLILTDTQAITIEDRTHIDAAFVDALILNPIRPDGSIWWLYPHDDGVFKWLKKEAERLGHPSLQSLLATQFLRSEVMA